MKFRYLPLLLTASLALPFAACDDDDFEDPEIIQVSSFTSDASLTLKVGASQQLSIKIEPAEATAKAINWVSSDGSIAAVNGSGQVTAVKVGSATITGTTPEGKSVTCKVTVEPATIVFSLNDKPLFEKDANGATHVYHKNSTVLGSITIEELTCITKDKKNPNISSIVAKDFWPEMTDAAYAILGNDSKYFAGWSTSFDGEPITSTFKKKYGQAPNEFEVEMFYEAAKQDTVFAVWKTRDLVDFELASGFLWSSTNLGASALKDFGNLYAWGEKSVKDVYSWAKYAYGTEYNLTKYCGDSYYGAKYQKYTEKKDAEGNVVKDENGNPVMELLPENDFQSGYYDALTEWASEDDPAFAAGYKWQTPTLADYEELFNSTDKVFYHRVENFQNYEGVNGWYLLKLDASKAEFKDYILEDIYEMVEKDGKQEVKKDDNGNPVVKTKHDPWIFVRDGIYWTNEYSPLDPHYANSFVVDENGGNLAPEPTERCEGHAIRPILHK